MIEFNVSNKKYQTQEIDYSWNPCTFICDNSSYLKNIANESVIPIVKL